MSTTRLSLGKYICGMTASLIIFLAGGWLILAPFALGYQPYGADWTYQAANDFATGIPVAVVALAGFVLFFYSLLGSLRAAGVLVSRPRVQQPQEAPAQSQPQTSAPYRSDLDRTLATLAAALAADLNSRRQEDNNQQTIPQLPTVKRREA
jgi:Na+-transporting methylmalonyl-CoA/oxaloacetate decarboxylase gamma subunit